MKKLIQVISITRWSQQAHCMRKWILQILAQNLAQVQNLTPQNLKAFALEHIAFDIGYQWYFAQNAGFRFKGYIGYESYSAKDMRATAANNQPNMDFNLASHALQYGLEARYLYDFIYGGEHTFGANIGVGFGGSSFFNAIMIPGDADVPASTHNFKSYTRATWTSGVGLHYFYHSHHQILLSYLYRGYTDELKTINPIISTSAFANHTIQLSYAYKF